MVKPVEHKEVRAKALESLEARAAYEEALREYDAHMEQEKTETNTIQPPAKTHTHIKKTPE
ncbi:hypothetical protein [Plesiomonas sp. PI-19]|uniref:hypothetical protein n=1 Tax=Plesiomonas sp. PI-19 TaxID=2898798 RepID=UPI001F40E754|nr:hypothetical protein [Plesiomonas sp. PI-19]MCE5164311.1 hypothetical protein [Plesiomonas sp. PI-19]